MSTLRVLPLGGLGEIGKSMSIVEFEGRILVIDTDVRFPTAEMHGIDLVLPDFAYLIERRDAIEAIVITHEHEDHLVDAREVGRVPDEELVIVTTGSQGEPFAALRRMANKEHRDVKLRSTPGPGDERAVNDTIDRLFQIGCDAVTAKDAPIHTSGNGARPGRDGVRRRRRARRPRFGGAAAPQRDVRRRHDAGGRDGFRPGRGHAHASRDRAPRRAGDRSGGGVRGRHPRGGRGLARPGAEHDVHGSDALEKILHDDLAGYVFRRLKRRPMIIPVVVEI